MPVEIGGLIGLCSRFYTSDDIVAICDSPPPLRAGPTITVYSNLEICSQNKRRICSRYKVTIYIFPGAQIIIIISLILSKVIFLKVLVPLIRLASSMSGGVSRCIKYSLTLPSLLTSCENMASHRERINYNGESSLPGC